MNVKKVHLRAIISVCWSAENVSLSSRETEIQLSLSIPSILYSWWNSTNQDFFFMKSLQKKLYRVLSGDLIIIKIHIKFWSPEQFFIDLSSCFWIFLFLKGLLSLQFKIREIESGINLKPQCSKTNLGVCYGC